MITKIKEIINSANDKKSLISEKFDNSNRTISNIAEYYMDNSNAFIELLGDLNKILDKDESYCTCGNPSKEGNCHFEGDENLIYCCADCGKQVKDNEKFSDDEN